MMKHKTQSVDLCVITDYLPTTNSKDEVYDRTDDLMNLVKRKYNLIIIDVFSASIGEDNKGK